MFDLAWILYIGKQKLGYTEKEIGHMTFRKWHTLYTAYRNTFDLENTLIAKGMGYKDLVNKVVHDIENVVSF